MYRSSVEGPNRRRRPLGRWKDRVKEYVSERGVKGNGMEDVRRYSFLDGVMDQWNVILEVFYFTSYTECTGRHM